MFKVSFLALKLLQLSKAVVTNENKNENENELTIKGFDCSMERANFSEISLLNVEECEKIPEKYKESMQIKIQMLQLSYKKQLDILQCKVFASLKVNLCFTSKLIYNHTKPGVYVSRNEPLKVFKPQCSSALNTRTFQFNYYQNELRSVELNADDTAYGDMTIRGKIDDQTGGCTASKFMMNGKLYDSHVLTLRYDIEINKIKGELDRKNEILTLNSKIKTKDYKKQSIFHTKEGNFFWKWYQISKKCNELKEISRVEGEIHNPIDNASAPIVILNKDKKTKLAITLNSKVKFCNTEVRSTFAEGLYLLLANSTDQFIETEKIEGYDVDQLINIKTLLSSSNLQQEINIGTSFNKVAVELCNNGRRNIMRELSDYGNRKVDEQKDQTLKGKLILNGGSIIRVISCSPITVMLRKNISKCYSDIPIQHEGSQIFLDAVTYILKKESTEIHCSNFMPAKFGIEDNLGNLKWICFSPNIYSGQNCPPPTILSPMQHKTLYTPIIHHIDANIYTKKQLEDYSKPYFKNIKNENFINKIIKRKNRKLGNQRGRTLEEMFTLILSNDQKPFNYAFFSKLWITGAGAWKWILTPMILSFIMTIIVNLFLLFRKIKLTFQKEGLSSKIAIYLICGLIKIGLPSTNHRCVINNFSERETLIKEIENKILKDLLPTLKQ